MNKLDYIIKLNIRSIICYERLTGKSFSLFKPEPDKVLPLLYCMLVANNDFTSSYEETVKYLFTDDKFLQELTKELEKQLKFQSQFSNKLFNVDRSDIEEEKEEVEDEKPIYISQLIPILSGECGLDINYILYEMHYSEIDEFIHYRDEKYKSEMEDKRMWTYLTMLPHIDAKKCKLESLIEFPWEKKKKKMEGLRQIKENRSKLDEFLKSGMLNNNTE